MGSQLGVAGEVLPAVEVHMTFKVRLPRIFHRRLEGQHQHPLGAKLLRELVGGEGLAEAHLRVPQETRDGMLILRPDRVEIIERLVDRLGLFTAHLKSSGDACR